MRALVIALMLGACSAYGADNRLILFDQSEFGAKKGLYLDFENSFPDGRTGNLDTMRLILGVADGQNWHFMETSPKPSYLDVLRIRAEVLPQRSRLWLNDRLIADQVVEFKPLVAPTATVNNTPSWAKSPVDYRMVLTSMAINGTAVPINASLSGPLALFEVPLPKAIPYTNHAGAALFIDATVTVERALDPATSAPFIDSYGQSIHASFVGKVHEDADLRNAIRHEATTSRSWKRPATWDAYGGEVKAGWHLKGTNYYRTVKHNGKWWLISPLGNPLFYTGLCTAPAIDWDRTPVTGREFLWQRSLPNDADLWKVNDWGAGADIRSFAQHSLNLKRTMGTDWKAEARLQCADRIRRWGFTGLGKWSDPLPSMPWIPVLGLDGVEKVGKHPDVFNRAVCVQIEQSLRKQIQPLLTNPWVLGWSIGNEYDELITPDEVRAALVKPGEFALKTRLREELTKIGGNISAPTNAEIETLRLVYAKHYYRTLYTTVKRIDSNHLYFGFWIVPGWWVNESDWDVSAPYCDVIGYDRYAESWQGIEDLLSRNDKPVLLGEFSFPAWYGGTRGFGRYNVFRETDKDSGEAYTKLLSAASRDPRCIGALWFQYRDQPLTGRGPGKGKALVHGEHYAFGFVDGTNRPKWDLVKPARLANLKAIPDRLATNP